MFKDVKFVIGVDIGICYQLVVGVGDGKRLILSVIVKVLDWEGLGCCV